MRYHPIELGSAPGESLDNKGPSTQRDLQMEDRASSVERTEPLTQEYGGNSMAILDIILNWISNNFLPALLAVAVVSLIGYIIRRNIISYILNKYYLIRNKTMIASVKSVYTYPIPESGPPEIEFTGNLCDEISDHFDYAVTNPDWGDNWATFDVENIPTSIRVKLEPKLNRSFHNPTPEMGGRSEDISGYKLVIETEDELVFGYSEMFPLLNFKSFAECVKDVIEAEYFPQQTTDSAHIQVKLTEGVPAGINEIDDTNLNIKGKVRDSELNLTFRTPDNLQQGIRKYFQPSN